MIRVGLPYYGADWQGGHSYLTTLLRAIASVAERRIEPVLLLTDEDRPSAAFADVEQHVRRGPWAGAAARRAGWLARAVLGHDVVEERWLRRARVAVVTHGRPLGHSGTPWIHWVGDLQHWIHPQLFGRRERSLREIVLRAGLRHAALVIASSEAERRLLLREGGVAPERVRALSFASVPVAAARDVLPLRAVRAAHRLPARWVHLPNQFWKHKNHEIVLEALALVPEVVVVATGSPRDYRNPGHYDAVMARVRALGLGERFRHLGFVDNATQVALLRHGIAVLNPSFYEGWSTSVEEAKSLGKRLLASDLAVHREQAAPRARYFAPTDAKTLAALLDEAWQSNDIDDDVAVDRALDDARARLRTFGERYQSFVLEAAGAAPAGRVGP